MAQTNVQAFSGDVAISSNLAVDTNTLFVDSVGNKVGIGTNAPDSRLHIEEPTSIGATTTLFHTETGFTGGSRGHFEIKEEKHGAGTGWSDFNLRLQRRVDSIVQGYMDFNPSGTDGDYGIAFGNSGGGGPGEIMRIGGLTGNVGIGKTNPGSALDVVGDVAISSNLAVDTNTLFVDSVGNKVGIGTANPHRLLDVSDSTAETAMHISGLASQSNVFIYMTETSNRNVGAVLHYSGRGTPQGFRVGHLENSTTPRYDFAIDRTSGNVGIGTDNPQGQLHISSGTSGDCVLILQADTDNNNESDNPRIEFRQDGALIESVIAQGNNDLQLKNGIEGITFWTGGTEVGGDHVINTIQRMFINNDGNVGIGTASPVGKLHIVHGTDGGATKDLDDQTIVL